jgi:hypothetical protein
MFMAALELESNQLECVQRVSLADFSSLENDFGPGFIRQTILVPHFGFQL